MAMGRYAPITKGGVSRPSATRSWWWADGRDRRQV